MSIERTLITRSQPYFLAAKAKTLIQCEAEKGCSPIINSYPVALEPYYEPIPVAGSLTSNIKKEIFGIHKDAREDFVNLRIWISPDQVFNWTRPELFIKSLKNLKNKIRFEIYGNARNIEIRFIIQEEDLSQLLTAFKSQFDRCELTIERDNLFDSLTTIDWEQIKFLDFFPLPPYSYLFTQPAELKMSPFDVIFTALAEIHPPAIGFYQIIFQGTAPEHDWHQNINILQDFEYGIKMMSGFPMAQKTPFQSPSSEIHGMAQEIESKAHNDKPIYAAAMRLGIIDPGNSKENDLRGLSIIANIFLHGGRPLSALNQDDYFIILNPEKTQEMFIKGNVHRPGFILNSSELSGMLHLPSAELLKARKHPVNLLETLPAKNNRILQGTPIGICSYAGTDQVICIPPEIRSRSTHLLARHGMGKSTVLEHMILDDIRTGAGVAVLDPHGDMINRLLQLIPEQHVEKVIYLFPGDREWVPLWNPITPVQNQDISRTADDIVFAIKNIVQGWGDRLENLLRHAIYALLLIPGSSFLDVSNLLRKKSKESLSLIEKIREVIDNETARIFWREDFTKYSAQDLNPPQHKLSKLLMSGNLSLMLSQPENRINFREIMDSGKILLVDLSGIGTEVRELLGSFILNLLHITAISRSDIAIEKREQYHIYCDEAHRFIRSSVEDMIAETRKFKVSLTLAHQYLKQFKPDVRDAILTSGSTIIFNVDMSDAHYLVKDLRDLVKPEDLAVFEIGDAIARIGTDIVKIRTKEALKVPEHNYRNRIIEESHKKYYRPVDEIKEMLANRDNRGNMPMKQFNNLSTENNNNEIDEFKYDEFE